MGEKDKLIAPDLEGPIEGAGHDKANNDKQKELEKEHHMDSRN